MDSSRLAAIVLSALSMTMAAAIFYHFNTGLKPYMEPLKDACGLNGEPKGQEPAHMKLGLSFVDGLHCLLTPFFLDCVASPAGRFFVLKTLEVLIALMALMAIEDSRSSARGLVRGSVIVLATAQLVGASVAIPFAWVPCYLLLTKPHVEGAFLPAGKAPAIIVSSLLAALLTAPLVAASLLPEPSQLQVVVNFNLLLPCLCLLWMFTPGGRQPGNAAAATALRAAAAVCFALHAASLADLLLHAGPDPRAVWSALAAVFEKATPAVMPANFMAFDFLGVLGAAAIFAVAELCGLAGAAAMLTKGLVIGPGAAFALACAEREARLAAGAAAAPPPEPESAFAQKVLARSRAPAGARAKDE